MFAGIALPLPKDSADWTSPSEDLTTRSAARGRACVTTAPLHFNLKCLNCNTPFALVNSMHGKSDFCSVDCRSSYQLRGDIRKKEVDQVYLDLKKYMDQEKGCGESSCGNGRDCEDFPVKVRSAEEVCPTSWEGIVSNLQDQCQGDGEENSLDARTKEHVQARGHLFREYRKSFCLENSTQHKKSDLGARPRRKGRRNGIHRPSDVHERPAPSKRTASVWRRFSRRA